MNLNTRAEALQKLRAFLGEAWAFIGLSFIEVAAATSNGVGELAVAQEATARVSKLAANEEDKLAAGKGKVSNFSMTSRSVLMILYSQCS